MKITVVYPSRSHSAYRIAADCFCELSEQVASCVTVSVSDEVFSPDPASDLTVLIGNDAVNHVTAALYLAKQTDAFGIRYGTDDYCIRSLCADGVRYLLLAGGRPRATIYAVYRYFEVFCGCRWFWDGDRIPNASLCVEGVDLCESPRFAIRGIRYFAHRSLHRFQAEHWSFDDWKREIDWLLKKRLNLFMLRIGMDDLFQKAFPDTVPYPDPNGRLPEAGGGYDDRSLFWSLEYRGELRKQLLQYAFARDLMHPEDCGTMSHWYSRTPKSFLEKQKPSLLPQSNNTYADPTGRVWDVRDKTNFENYLRLTDTHIKEYGKPEIFHTIGLGERLYSADAEENKRMKLFVYRKIATAVQEKYPGAPLLIASWDLWRHFTPQEVRELVAELDPSSAMILDYTSDTLTDNNFTQWGVLQGFPWIFGIFGGYEPNNELRGYYAWTSERLALAKADPMCRGLVLWPEFSHGDPFMLEYLAHNAWDSRTPSVEELTERYCRDRYPAPLFDDMAAIWKKLMPIVSLCAWSTGKIYYHTDEDLFVQITRRADFKKEKREAYRKKLLPIARQQNAAVEILHRLSKIEVADSMTERDVFDIARTVIGRFLNAAILCCELCYAEDAPTDELTAAMHRAEQLMQRMIEVLGAHEDYSLYKTLCCLEAVAKTNPQFEEVLKSNATCDYCRSYIYENAKHLYLPEMQALFAAVVSSAREGGDVNRAAVKAAAEDLQKRFFATPLAQMQEKARSLSSVLEDAACEIAALTLPSC